MNQKGGIFLGIMALIVFILMGAFFIAVFEPLNQNFNISAGGVVGKNALYDSGSNSEALIFGGPLLFIIGGLYLFFKGGQAQW